MDLSYLAVHLIVAIVCAGIANMIIPRQIPGKFLGLVLIGLLGVWVGELGFRLLKAQQSLNHPFFHWGLQGVAIVPSIIGSIIVLYVVTTFVRRGSH